MSADTEVLLVEDEADLAAASAHAPGVDDEGLRIGRGFASSDWG